MQDETPNADSSFEQAMERLLRPKLEPCGCMRVGFTMLCCEAHNPWFQLFGNEDSGAPIVVSRRR